MTRRKRDLDDGDDDSDSSSLNASDREDDPFADPNLREERTLFDNPYRNKRQRRNEKQQALYGVFGGDSDEEGGYDGGRCGSRIGGVKKGKAPAFVSGKGKAAKNKNPLYDVGSGNEDGNEDADGEYDLGIKDTNDDEDGFAIEGEDDLDANRKASPRILDEDETELEEAQPTYVKPRTSGIGFKSSASSFSASLQPSFLKSKISDDSIPSLSNGTIRFSNDQTNLSPAPVLKTNSSWTTTITTATSSLDNDGLPSTFANRSQRFVRSGTSTTSSASLPAAELAHFSKLQGTFGARMLAKMGWEAGSGLGTSKEGIVTPIESKLRPQGAGIAFKGFKEKTEQSKLEARRRGEVVSDDEDEKVRWQRRKAKEEKKRSDVWKKPKKTKINVQHKTYEEILAEAGQELTQSGIGQIIDATGAVPREVSSLAHISLNSWSPSNDPTRIPEIRHNIRLIADACKTHLNGLAREATSLQERKTFVINEEARIRKKIADEVELISRLQQIQLVANDINALAKELTYNYEVSLEPFSPLVHKLVDEFSKEFDLYQLDEIVVAAIAPLLRRMTASWIPLENPGAFVSTFQGWHQALKVKEECAPQVEINVYGSATTAPHPDITEPMTPFESLLWNVWLPKVRTAINNDWAPEDPHPALKLYESWSSFLPSFIRDNMMDQLILPKVQKAVADWDPKRSEVALQAIVFPWLPHVGLRLEVFIGDARRKVKGLLRSWTVGDEKPVDLLAWKALYDDGEWDLTMLKYVVPKLGATLRSEFVINPRNQQMEPLQNVLQWSDVLRPSILSKIIEFEFFPKWLDILYIWLIQPRFSFEEIGQWYSFWKGVFPELVMSMPGVGRGFMRGLQLINTAIELGPEAPAKLVRPDFRAEATATADTLSLHLPPSADKLAAVGTTNKGRARPSARSQEITFRSIVEEYAAAQNLLFVPLGRAHERSRVPLFKVSLTADGRKGLLVYVLDDAVWAAREGAGDDRGDFVAIGLEDMVRRALSV